MIELRCTNIRVKGGHRVVCNSLLARVSVELASALDDKRTIAVYCVQCREWKKLLAPHAGLRDGGIPHGARDQAAG